MTYQDIMAAANVSFIMFSPSRTHKTEGSFEIVQKAALKEKDLADYRYVGPMATNTNVIKFVSAT